MDETTQSGTKLRFLSGDALSKAWRRPGYIVRIFEPKGRYLKLTVALTDCLYHVDDEMAFMVTFSAPWDWWSDDSELPYTEMDWASAEEIRLMASILLCEHSEGPRLCFYPTRYPLRLDATTLDLSSPDAVIAVKELLRECVTNPEAHPNAHVVQECFSKEYQFVPDEEFFLDRRTEFLKAIAPTDFLVLRGIATLIRAEMVAAHRELWEEATVIVFIALEASFQLVLRELKRNGMTQPTATDAGAWIARTFDEPLGLQPDGVTRYYEEFYEQRVMTLHPVSRHGILPYAPIMHGDFMFLRRSLRTVFAYLVSGKHSPEFLAAIEEHHLWSERQLSKTTK